MLGEKPRQQRANDHESPQRPRSPHFRAPRISWQCLAERVAYGSDVSLTGRFRQPRETKSEGDPYSRSDVVHEGLSSCVHLQIAIVPLHRVAEEVSRAAITSAITSEGSMIRHMLTALALVSAASLASPAVGDTQTFKVEKFDIKGEGGTDYVAVESTTGRVFVARATHMMVVEGATGKVLGDIPNTPGVHGAGLATK